MMNKITMYFEEKWQMSPFFRVNVYSGIAYFIPTILFMGYLVCLSVSNQGNQNLNELYKLLLAMFAIIPVSLLFDALTKYFLIAKRGIFPNDPEKILKEFKHVLFLNVVYLGISVFFITFLALLLNQSHTFNTELIEFIKAHKDVLIQAAQN